MDEWADRQDAPRAPDRGPDGGTEPEDEVPGAAAARGGGRPARARGGQGCITGVGSRARGPAGG
ncbi:hypothetical protein AB0F64_27375, partial [Streptomyces sp. NPDC026294]